VRFAKDARRKGAQSAANRTLGSNLTRFSFYIKDLLAVQGVSSEPVSAEFPDMQGKNSEFV